MSLDPQTKRLRAKQVGMLMQAYRRGYTPVEGSNRLSQEGLLRLMGQVDTKYLERYNHSTVARWESGATQPTKDRLEVFGRALGISPGEIEGMISLAGLYDDPITKRKSKSTDGESTEAPETALAQSSANEASLEEVQQTDASRIVRYLLTRLALPGLVVAGSGYLLASLGWNASWVMMLYVNLAMGLILVQSFMNLRRTSELRELFFISVFFLLGGNVLLAPVLRMDPYGFYAIANFGGTPMPYLFALVANLLLSLLAGLMFEYLWRWQYDSGKGASSAYCRAGWVAFPPLGVIYLVCVSFSCLGAWIYLLSVFAVLGAATMAMLILRDKEVTFVEWERKLLLQGAVAIIVVLTGLGGMATMILYLEPSFLAIPNHSFFRSWEIDFALLGYSMDELMDRYRLGAVWSSLATLVYMVIAVGGSLIVAIYRFGDSEEKAPIVLQ